LAEEKSEAPTPRRLQKAREQGRVAVSRELPVLVGLAAGLAALAAEADRGAVAGWLADSLQRMRYDGATTWKAAGACVAWVLAPPALAACVGVLAATLLQTGFLIHPATLQPDLGRISPLAGLKRLFSLQALVQAGKAVVKLAVLAACLYVAIAHLLPMLPATPFYRPEALFVAVRGAGLRLMLPVLMAQAAIATADLLWERVHFARQQRMSFQEIKDEHKESEGNPQVRQRLRQLVRLRARRRMLKAVPKAAVVVTNPTHYAVALSYERGSQAAPRLVAKGADEVAARIRELARQHRVPIVGNPPLAQALFRIDIDTEIPAEHFRAVAEIIAYVWRMRAQVGRL
jgi:flagellar biosynthetic protein FlhB